MGVRVSERDEVRDRLTKRGSRRGRRAMRVESSRSRCVGTARPRGNSDRKWLAVVLAVRNGVRYTSKSETASDSNPIDV